MKLGYKNVKRMHINQKKVVKIYVGKTLTTYYSPDVAYFYSSRSEDRELVAAITTNRNGVIETIPDDLISSTEDYEFKGWYDSSSGRYAKAGMQISKDTYFYPEWRPTSIIIPPLGDYDEAGYIYVTPTMSESVVDYLQSEEFYSNYGRDPNKRYIELYTFQTEDGIFAEGAEGGNYTKYYLCNPNVLNEGYYDEYENYYPPVFSGYTYSTDITVPDVGAWFALAKDLASSNSPIAVVGIDTPTMSWVAGEYAAYLIIVSTAEYGDLVVLRVAKPDKGGAFGAWEDRELLDSDLILGKGDSGYFTAFSPYDSVYNQCAYQFIRYQDFVNGFVPLE